MIEYEQMVARLIKPGQDIIDQMTPEKAHLWHMATGAAGEGGELLDAFKAHCVYNKPLDIENVIEELGDLEFFMEGIRAELQITREQTLIANMEKLGVRYSSGTFSDEQAQNRADKQDVPE